jgi:sulfatase modifying factor 1
MVTRFVLRSLGLLALALAMPAQALVSAVTLQASFPAPQPVGTPLTLTAAATATGAVVYRFRVGRKSGASFGWVTLRDYSADASCRWTPTDPGIYSLAVYARSAGSTAAYESYKTLGFTINPLPLAGVAVEVSPRPVQTLGYPVAVVATALDGLSPEFKFRVGYLADGSYRWELLRDYSTSAEMTWTPLIPGAYLLEVAARDRGSAASASVRVPCRVLAPAAPTLTGFTPASGLMGATVMLTGTTFTGATAVAFNGLAAAFTVTSATTLTATVPAGATTGPLTVTTPGGTVTSAGVFTVTGAMNPQDGAEMVWVPGGVFIMGTPTENSWTPTEQQVTLSGFWLYKYEVTVAQYRAFCAATDRPLPPFPTGYSWAGHSGWDAPSLQIHPIVNVAWYDAAAYAEWARVQLPTEAQWEYAARGPAGRNYPWGGTAISSDPYNGWDLTKCANTSNSNVLGLSTWPVGSFPSGTSWNGVHDLAGNVWEWCADWFGPYSSTPVTNPQGASSGEFRVLRGGSWYFPISHARGAVRYVYAQHYRDNNIGFRCAASSPAP